MIKIVGLLLLLLTFAACNGGGGDGGGGTTSSTSPDGSPTPSPIQSKISGTFYIAGEPASGKEVCLDQNCTTTNSDGTYELSLSGSAPYKLIGKVSNDKQFKVTSYSESVHINELSHAMTVSYELNNYGIDDEALLDKVKEEVKKIVPVSFGDPLNGFTPDGATDLAYRAMRYMSFEVVDGDLVVKDKAGTNEITRISLFNLANGVVPNTISGKDFYDQMLNVFEFYPSKPGEIRTPSFLAVKRGNIAYDGSSFNLYWDRIPDKDTDEVQYQVYRHYRGVPNYDLNLIKTQFGAQYHYWYDRKDSFPSNVREPYMDVRYSVIAKKRVNGQTYTSDRVYNSRWYRFGALLDFDVSNNERGGIKISFDPVPGATQYFLYHADLRGRSSEDRISFYDISNNSNVSFREKDGKFEFFYSTLPTTLIHGFFVLSNVDGFNPSSPFTAKVAYSKVGSPDVDASAPYVSINNGKLVASNLFAFYKYLVQFKTPAETDWKNSFSFYGQGNTTVDVPGYKGVNYQYRVETTLNDGRKAHSNIVQHTPALIIPGFQASQERNRSVGISWQPVPNAKEYQLYRDNQLIHTQSARSWTMSYGDMNLSPGNTYYYRIKVLTNDGLSGFSEAVAGKTILITNPSPPPGPGLRTASKGLDGEVKLFIHRPNKNVNLELHRATSEAGPYNVISFEFEGESVIKDTSPSPGTKYYYKLSTYIYGDTGVKVSSILTPAVEGYCRNEMVDNSLPTVNVTKTERSNEVYLSFESDPAIDSYRITKGSKVYETTSPYFSDDDPDSTNEYMIEGLAVSGKSTPTYISATPPNKPTRLTASDWRNYVIFLNFDRVVGAKAYDIYASDSHNGYFYKVKRYFPEEPKMEKVNYNDKIGRAVERYYYVVPVLEDDSLGTASEKIRGRSLRPPPPAITNPTSGGGSGSQVGSASGNTSNVSAGSGKAGETTIFNSSAGSCSFSSLSIKYRFDKFMGYLTRAFIMKWETSGEDDDCMGNTGIALKITGSGGQVGFTVVHPLAVKAGTGYSAYDVPGSPSWSQAFKKSDGSFMSEAEAKSLYDSISIVEIIDVKKY